MVIYCVLLFSLFVVANTEIDIGKAFDNLLSNAQSDETKGNNGNSETRIGPGGQAIEDAGKEAWNTIGEAVWNVVGKEPWNGAGKEPWSGSGKGDGNGGESDGDNGSGKGDGNDGKSDDENGSGKDDENGGENEPPYTYEFIDPKVNPFLIQTDGSINMKTTVEEIVRDGGSVTATKNDWQIVGSTRVFLSKKAEMKQINTKTGETKNKKVEQMVRINPNGKEVSFEVDLSDVPCGWAFEVNLVDTFTTGDIGFDIPNYVFPFSASAFQFLFANSHALEMASILCLEDPRKDYSEKVHNTYTDLTDTTGDTTLDGTKPFQVITRFETDAISQKYVQNKKTFNGGTITGKAATDILAIIENNGVFVVELWAMFEENSEKISETSHSEIEGECKEGRDTDPNLVMGTIKNVKMTSLQESRRLRGQS